MSAPSETDWSYLAEHHVYKCLGSLPLCEGKNNKCFSVVIIHFFLHLLIQMVWESQQSLEYNVAKALRTLQALPPWNLPGCDLPHSCLLSYSYWHHYLESNRQTLLNCQKRSHEFPSLLSHLLMSRGNKCNDGSDTSTSQGMPRTVNRPPEVRWEACNRFSFTVPQRGHPYWHMDLGLLVYRTVRQWNSVV